MLVEANAKINIALNIIEKRVDHYHNLDMVNLPLKIHDTIDINIIPRGMSDSCLTSDDVNLPLNEKNLCYIALKKMREHFGFTELFRIHIHKVLPSSAGLGGGSSDAAAVMKAIVKLLKIKTTDEELSKIAQEVGADVPYFICNKPARINGIGEFVTPINIKGKYDVLLVKPEKGTSTKVVFNASNSDTWGSANIAKVMEALSNSDFDLLSRHIANDLEETATTFVPEIASIKEELRNDGFNIVGMTGSGTTVFAILPNKKVDKKLIEKYRNKYAFVEVTSVML